MNWVWPMAPAHEPFIAPALISPRWTILRAATSCLRPNFASRPPDQASVASDRMVFLTSFGLVEHPAVMAFDAPDRRDDVAVDAIAGFDARQQRRIAWRPPSCPR